MKLSVRLSIAFAMVAAVFLAEACRSRGKQTVKTISTPTEIPMPIQTDATAVTSPAEEFVREQPEDSILTSAIDEVNRTAQARGWIRDAFFAYDSSYLDPTAHDALQSSATWLRRNVTFGLLIEGHCDERGTEQYNLALGERRANSARDYLIQLGVDPDRIRTISYGEERPFALGHNESAWALNRRARLILERLPSLLGSASQPGPKR